MSQSIAGGGAGQVGQPQGPKVVFKSSWDKLQDRFGRAATIAAAVLTVPLGLTPLLLFGAFGGFRKTVHVYDPSRHATIDTNLREADVRKLKAAAASESTLVQAARRTMALKILKETDARELPFLERLPTNLLTDAANKLVEGKADALVALRAEHGTLVQARIDPDTARSVKDFGLSQKNKATEKTVGTFEAVQAANHQDAQGAQAQGKRIREFLAELVFPANPADTGTPEAKRLRELFITHWETIKDIAAKPDILDDLGWPPAMTEALKAQFQNPALRNLSKLWTPIAKIALTGFKESVFEDIAAQIKSALETFSFDGIAGDQLANLAPGPETGNLGKFFSAVLKGYFDGQDEGDKRAMIASFLRESKPGDSPERQLVALLKGAGPYLQKLLQLFGDQATGELKAALGELKTNLAPIPAEVKRAILADIVKNSDGKIAKIDDLRSLGAASVGETITARVSPADGGTSRQVVIKLLRPGIRERAAREREFFEREAKKIPGMAGTFKGIADQIDTEMDLRREAANLRQAQVYNRGAPNVKAMKLAEGIETTGSVMALQRAPGATVKKTMDFLQASVEKPLTRHPGLDGHEPLVPLELGHKLASGIEAMSRKWFQEAIFGSGFYHGDMHSGNMMFSTATDVAADGLLTAIDMGNTATLTADQRQAIFRMVGAVGIRNSRIFIRDFERLLSPDGKLVMNDPENRQRFTAVVAEIMTAESMSQANVAIDRLLLNMGAITQDEFQNREAEHLNAPEDDEPRLSPGRRIQQLLRAANVVGLEIPGTIANFARSQLMLQTAGEEIYRINKKMHMNAISQAFQEYLPALKFLDEIDADLSPTIRERVKAARDLSGVGNVARALNIIAAEQKLAPSFQTGSNVDIEAAKKNWEVLEQKSGLMIKQSEVPAPVRPNFTQIIRQVIKDNRAASVGLLGADLITFMTTAPRP